MNGTNVSVKEDSFNQSVEIIFTELFISLFFIDAYE